MSFNNDLQKALFEFIIRLADDRLILGQRLSELCGHAAVLEEDIALTNISLDCFGQANALLEYAAEIENKGRDADALTFLREEREFKNINLLEQPNTDFAYTIVKQFLYDAFAILYYEALSNSKDETISAIFAKSLKEVKYHLRHSKKWILRLGDGTEESNLKVQKAVNDLWVFSNELFYEDEINKQLNENGISFSTSTIKEKWFSIIKDTFEKAKIEIPEEDESYISYGRQGLHTEHLGHLLAEMQILVRTHPDAKW